MLSGKLPVNSRLLVVKFGGVKSCFWNECPDPYIFQGLTLSFIHLSLEITYKRILVPSGGLHCFLWLWILETTPILSMIVNLRRLSVAQFLWSDRGEPHFLLWLCRKEPTEKVKPIAQDWITDARTKVTTISYTRTSLKNSEFMWMASNLQLPSIKSSHSHYLLQRYQFFYVNLSTYFLTTP